MKKTVSLVLSVLLALGVFAVPGVIASAEEYNGFLYEISDGCATITGYTGESTAVEIPSAVNGIPVTGIAQDAFNQKSIGSVTIPDSVVSIGEYAFSWCESLGSVTLGGGVESIGDGAFYKCPITEIEIPDSVTSIGESAFSNCSSLGSVTLGGSVTSIGNSAFRGCQIESIAIPDSVVSIGEYAFSWCESLGSVTLGGSVTSIGNNAFYSCPIEEIEIPDSVMSIGDSAFGYCSSLGTVTLGEGVVSIGNSAFYSCPISEISIPGSVESIGSNAFSGCGALGSVTLGNSVESIGSGAFYSCPISSIDIPDSVVSIGDNAFQNCTNLGSVTLGGGVVSIGSYAFQGCPIESIEIPDSVTSIGDSAFRNCASLGSVTLGGSVTSIGNNAFYSCPIEEIEIPDSVTSIGESAFQGCPITEIEIPDSVTSIGDSAFDRCESLGTVTLGEGVESIGNYAFNKCPITEIEIPGSVRTIGESAFEGCSSLEKVTMSAGTEQIVMFAFYGCNAISDVYFNGTEEEWNKIDIGIRNDPLTNAPKHFSDIGFTSHALVLSGEIGTVFNVKVPEGFEGALQKVTFSVGKNKVSEMSASDAHFNTETGLYEFICYTGAYNMADEIRPVLIYTEGNEEKSVPGARYSAKDYIDFVRGNTGSYTQEVVDLVNSIADFGHYSQAYLSRIHGYTCGDGEDDKYAEMTTFASDSFDYGEVTAAVEEKYPTVTNKSDKVTKVSVSLDLESKTNLYIYIQVQDGVKPDSASLADNTALPVTKKSGNTYKVAINGIKASQLGDDFTITVKAGGETLVTVTVSPMTYVLVVFLYDVGPMAQDDIRNTVCALYYYGKAAEAVTA